MTVNFSIRKCSVSDVVSVVAYGEELFQRERNERLKEAMEENAILHEKLGYDNHEFVAFRYRNWIIEGIPDQILDDRVEECKIISKASNIKKLKFTAWLQAGIYALALRLPKFSVVFHRKYDEKIEREYMRFDYDTEVEEPKIKAVLDEALKILEKLRDLHFAAKQLMTVGWDNERL